MTSPLGVGIHARDNVHAELAATRQHLPERIAVAQELTAVMQRDLRRIERHASPRAKAGRVGVNPFEVVEPEGRLVASRVVFDEGQLGPPHRPVEPVRRRARLGERRLRP